MDAREEMFAHGFVGSSGRELATMLVHASIIPEVDAPVRHASELDMIRWWASVREKHDIDIANVFEIHPPDNDIETFFTTVKDGFKDLPPLRPGKYIRPDMLHHVHALWHKLEETKPNLIIALGNTACWATLGEAKISVIRGTVKTSARFGIKVLPTYHPAAVLRQWNLRTIVLSDLEKAKREAETTIVERIKRWVTVEPSISDIIEWLQRPAQYYAVDIENHWGPISMIGFARSADDALVIPFIDETKPDWSYWPTLEEEVQAWKLADQALRAPVPKLFQNGIYDLTHLLRSGFRPSLCQDDTMLLHHAIYPEMLKGLGFLGSYIFR